MCTMQNELSGSIHYESHQLRFRAWSREELNSAELDGPEVSLCFGSEVAKRL
jgi:hypothetical protein